MQVIDEKDEYHQVIEPGGEIRMALMRQRSQIVKRQRLERKQLAKRQQQRWAIEAQPRAQRLRGAGVAYGTVSPAHMRAYVNRAPMRLNRRASATRPKRINSSSPRSNPGAYCI